jgi:hypothetical protein
VAFETPYSAASPSADDAADDEFERQKDHD